MALEIKVNNRLTLAVWRHWPAGTVKDVVSPRLTEYFDDCHRRPVATEYVSLGGLPHLARVAS